MKSDLLTDAQQGNVLGGTVQCHPEQSGGENQSVSVGLLLEASEESLEKGRSILDWLLTG